MDAARNGMGEYAKVLLTIRAAHPSNANPVNELTLTS
jgi:hypothetical protein